ncbi:MAG: aromatic ring-hydroxylating dioxygenase subunit alpha, partial [Peptostreptococcaceae bacterium]|nr:aromatic ring-hydroxylating dioxygenase subunit alpha [Peptostreptococcaceae bacterium]
EAQCPFHGFQYDKDDLVKLIPANGSSSPVPQRYHVNSYHAQEAYGFIWVFWSDQTSAVPELPFFEELKENFFIQS